MGIAVLSVIAASPAADDGHMVCEFPPHGTVMIVQFGRSTFNAIAGGHEEMASWQDGNFRWIQPAPEGDLLAYYEAFLDPNRGIARNVFPNVTSAVGICDQSSMEPYDEGAGRDQTGRHMEQLEVLSLLRN